MKTKTGLVLDKPPKADLQDYDRQEQEPNLDLVLQIRRDDSAPDAGSKWQLANLLEGEPIELNDDQRLYAAALMRHAATLLAGEYKAAEMTGAELVIHFANQARLMAKLALGDWVTYIHAAVEEMGVDNVAGALGLMPEEVNFYLTFRPYLPRRIMAGIDPYPRMFPKKYLTRKKTATKSLSSRLPGGWHEPKERRKVAKRLASTELIPTAGRQQKELKP